MGNNLQSHIRDLQPYVEAGNHLCTNILPRLRMQIPVRVCQNLYGRLAPRVHVTGTFSCFSSQHSSSGYFSITKSMMRVAMSLPFISSLIWPFARGASAGEGCMLTRRMKESVSSMGMESRNSHVVAFPDRRFGDRETQLHAIHERESPPTTALVLITPCLRII